jgi:hypothetical protein
MADEQSPMATWVSGLREAASVLCAEHGQLAYWVGLAADHLPNVTAERDQYKQIAVRQANEMRRMQAAIGGSAREAWPAGWEHMGHE